MKKLALSSIITFMFSTLAALGHEVWIEPVEWQVQSQSDIKANIYNGEHFEGLALIWNDQAVVRAEAWNDGRVSKISGRLGDRPALATSLHKDGLITLLYQSVHQTVDYESYESFASFVDEKGHGWVLERHHQRKLSSASIKEAYARFAKSLIRSGSGYGEDALRGMELELVAMTNPYVTPLTKKMQVRLYYKHAVLPQNQVTVFERSQDGSVSTTILQTDHNGEASFLVEQGATYLVDAVILREPARSLVIDSRGAVWESLWASLTFKLPEGQ
ncbi:DUF4198 domain-containing protein [uncultured Roseovarius sp.]|uniref:DUF4198 domain-containing protein n=1 Tax=uncultured Roseovarius sp. TaxID=293344 RepID=UPI00262C52F4|nr:DUF4198 domain-containing protein [uncultured Roseovarius sp.]